MTDTACLTLNPDIDETCTALMVAGSEESWGPSVRTVTNPCPGQIGDTLVFISVAPGPGFDVGGEMWVTPPGATLLTQWEEPGTFVQRVRIWTAPNNGATSFTFGYVTQNGTESFTNQTAAIICLDGPALYSGASVWNGDNSTTTDYSPVPTPTADTLVLAIATSQNDDTVTAGPTGYAEVLNNTAGPGTRRLLAVHTANSTLTTTDPTPATFDNTTASHQNVTLAFHCEEAPVGLCQELAPSLRTIDIVPADPNTWGPARPDGQLITGGDRFNPGDTTGNILGLTFDANLEVHSFQMQDGDTRRFYTDTVGGLPALCGKYQFVNDGSYVPPPAGPTGQGYVDSPPSDPLFFDGSRFDMAFFGNQGEVGHTGIGNQADEFKVAITFWGEPWHQATDPTTALWEFHAPVSQGGTSPLLISIRNGQATLFSRYNATAIPVGTNANSITSSLTLGSCPIVQNAWNTLIVSGRIDPVGGTGYARMFKVDGVTGACTQVVDHGSDFGYVFNDPNINRQFYHMLKTYDFHQFPSATAPNWDDTYGNVRRMCYASWTLTDDPSCTDADMCSHAAFRAGATCNPNGGPAPEPEPEPAGLTSTFSTDTGNCWEQQTSEPGNTITVNGDGTITATAGGFNDTVGTHYARARCRLNNEYGCHITGEFTLCGTIEPEPGFYNNQNTFMRLLGTDNFTVSTGGLEWRIGLTVFTDGSLHLFSDHENTSVIDLWSDPNPAALIPEGQPTEVCMTIDPAGSWSMSIGGTVVTSGNGPVVPPTVPAGEAQVVNVFAGIDGASGQDTAPVSVTVHAATVTAAASETNC